MFALWLLPEEKAHDKLSQVIQRLSAAHGTPLFAPHITILTGLDSNKNTLMEQGANLAVELFSMKIKLTKFGKSDEHYKSLYLKAEYTSQLAELFQFARDKFSHQVAKSFMPHVSLMYGEVDAAVKDGIISELGNELFFSFECRSMALVNMKEENPANWDILEDYVI